MLGCRNSQTITHNSLSNAYYLLNPLWGVLVDSSSPYDVYRRGVVQTSATTAELGWIPTGATATSGDVGLHVPDVLMVVCKVI